MPKGMKTCPQCKKDVGVRTAVCQSCNFAFGVAATPKAKHEGSHYGCGVIIAPAGKCPVQFGGDALDWYAQLIGKVPNLSMHGAVY